MKTLLYFLILSTLLFSFNKTTQQRPQDFVEVKKVIPDIVQDMRYAGSNNFIGKPVKGYNQPKAILLEVAAKALFEAQQDLKNQGYCLKIFDAYRPQTAVDHFIEWARNPEDTLKKQQFYPKVDKASLFRLGYISTKSGHSRGGTVDLTIIDSNTGEELDMGGTYDFFGERSHHDSTEITPQQKENRELLRKTMNKYGFRPYPQEWWHYTYRMETYPERYFNFMVE